MNPTEILRFRAGHRIALFEDGAEAFVAMEDAIAEAKEHVHLETYILRTDRLGRRLLDLLARRVREGVSVRVIYDAVGSRGIDRRLLASYAADGIEFEEWNPPARWRWRFRPRRRDHRKLLLVDGRIGFLGGLNVGDEYVGQGRDRLRWRDAHVQIEGPGLNELEAIFVESWFRAGGASFDWQPGVARAAETGGEHSLAILADGPMYPRRRMRDFFLDELERAESRVLLVSPYFAPGPKVLDAIEEASDRGVAIELVMAGRTDHPLMRRAARVLSLRLIRRGVRVFEEPQAMMHAKLAAFDDRVAVVGTSNLDRQSLVHSCEVNAVFAGDAVPRWIREHFGPERSGLIELDAPALERGGVLRWIADRWATFWAQL